MSAPGVSATLRVEQEMAGVRWKTNIRGVVDAPAATKKVDPEPRFQLQSEEMP